MVEQRTVPDEEGRRRNRPEPERQEGARVTAGAGSTEALPLRRATPRQIAVRRSARHARCSSPLPALSPMYGSPPRRRRAHPGCPRTPQRARAEPRGVRPGLPSGSGERVWRQGSSLRPARRQRSRRASPKPPPKGSDRLSRPNSQEFRSSASASSASETSASAIEGMSAAIRVDSTAKEGAARSIAPAASPASWPTSVRPSHHAAATATSANTRKSERVASTELPGSAVASRRSR